MGEKDRLTKERINQVLLYYEKPIRENRGNLKSMQNAIWAILYHSIEPKKNITLEEQRKFWPVGQTSWCKYNSDKETKKETYNSKNNEHLEPIFQRLSFQELLSRCFKGLTQNKSCCCCVRGSLLLQHRGRSQTASNDCIWDSKCRRRIL